MVDEVVKEVRTHVNIFLRTREYVDGHVGVALIADILGKEIAVTEEQPTEEAAIKALLVGWRGRSG